MDGAARVRKGSSGGARRPNLRGIAARRYCQRDAVAARQGNWKHRQLNCSEGSLYIAHRARQHQFRRDPHQVIVKIRATGDCPA